MIMFIIEDMLFDTSICPLSIIELNIYLDKFYIVYKNIIITTFIKIIINLLKIKNFKIIKLIFTN